MAFRECPIVERIVWAEGLCSLRIDASIESFQPGQFVNLALDLEGERVKRAYSLASRRDAIPEIYLVSVANGRVSPRLAALEVGDLVLFDPRPHGFFVLDEIPEPRELWLVATGTGLGPFMAILREGEVLSRHRAVRLVHSVREEQHLGYRAELERLAATHPSFRYLPVITRERVAGLLHGRIPTLLATGSLECAAELTVAPERSHVMMCGNPGMLDEVGRSLSERGLARHRRRTPGHLTSEAYW